MYPELKHFGSIEVPDESSDFSSSASPVMQMPRAPTRQRAANTRASLPLLWRPHDHHRDLRARMRAAISSDDAGGYAASPSDRPLRNPITGDRKARRGRKRWAGRLTHVAVVAMPARTSTK